MASFSDPSASLDEPLDLYLHGYISSRLMRLGSTSPVDEEEGLPVTIAVASPSSFLPPSLQPPILEIC